MKKVLKLFVAIIATTILCGCGETNTPQNPNSPKNPDSSEDVKKVQIVFSNQSEDNYHVVVESPILSDQFDIAGNKNITNVYETSKNWFYVTIRMTQSDGYYFYPTEHVAEVQIVAGKLTICWDNDSWWTK